ncbi:hypothetical protein MTO96_034155 [Rhipicephalus appendiculatus]
MTTGESQMVQTHVWKSQAAVNTEELTALVVVARALQQDVLEGFFRRTLRTRWTPVAGEAKESLRGATRVVAEGRWAALVTRQTVSPALVQGEREAEVSGESRDEGVSGHTKEVLVVEPAENGVDLLAIPTVECGLTQGDEEDAHPGPSYSVALVSGTTPECVGRKQGDWDDCEQDDAPRKRKKLQLKPRSVPVEANQEGDAVPKAAKVASRASSSIFGGAQPVDTASREREIEARLARQREEEERRRIRRRQPFQASLKDDWLRRSSVASGSLRPRCSSESDSDGYDDEGRQPLSRQYGNDGGQHSKSSEHGPLAVYDALVQGEPGDSAEHPPADHIRPPYF